MLVFSDVQICMSMHIGMGYVKFGYDFIFIFVPTGKIHGFANTLGTQSQFALNLVQALGAQGHLLRIPAEALGAQSS